MVKVSLTQAQYDAKVAELAEKGIKLDGNQGQVSKEGVTVSYFYDAGALTLQVMRKPMLVSTKFCEDKLREWLGA